MSSGGARPLYSGELEGIFDLDFEEDDKDYDKDLSPSHQEKFNILSDEEEEYPDTSKDTLDDTAQDKIVLPPRSEPVTFRVPTVNKLTTLSQSAPSPGPIHKQKNSDPLSTSVIGTSPMIKKRTIRW